MKVTDTEKLYAWLCGVYGIECSADEEPTPQKLNRIRQKVLGHKRHSERYRALASALATAVEDDQIHEIAAHPQPGDPAQ